MTAPEQELSFSSHAKPCIYHTQTDTTILYRVIYQKLWVARSYLIFVSSLMISIIFDWHKKESMWSKSILQGACSCLPITTVLRYVVVIRLSPLLHFLGNVLKNLLGRGGSLHPKNSLQVFPHILPHILESYYKILLT